MTTAQSWKKTKFIGSVGPGYFWSNLKNLSQTYAGKWLNLLIYFWTSWYKGYHVYKKCLFKDFFKIIFQSLNYFVAKLNVHIFSDIFDLIIYWIQIFSYFPNTPNLVNWSTTQLHWKFTWVSLSTVSKSFIIQYWVLRKKRLKFVL